MIFQGLNFQQDKHSETLYSALFEVSTIIIIIKLLASDWCPALQFIFKIFKKKTPQLGEKSCKKEQTWKNARNM